MEYSSKLNEELKLKLEKLLSLDQSKVNLVNEMLELMSNEYDQKQVIIHKSFLNDMLENPELYEGVVSLRGLVDTIRERRDNSSDIKNFAEILNHIESKVHGSGGQVKQMVKDICQDNETLIHKIINSKDDNERIESLNTLIKMIQGVEGIKDERLLTIDTRNTILKPNSLEDEPEKKTNNYNQVVYQSGGDIDYLMQNIAQNKNNIGFIFALMLALNALCTEIHKMKLLDMYDPQLLGRDAKYFNRFLDELLKDMGSNKDAGGDLYKYLQMVMNGTDENLKRKYREYLNKFGGAGINWSPKPNDKDAEDEEAKKLAVVLQQYVQGLNDRTRAICQGKGFNIDGFPIVDGRILFPLKKDKDGKDTDEIDSSWFDSSNKNLEAITDDLAAMETKLKGLVDASSKTMEATNSLIFNLIGALGQMYRGQ